MPAPVRFRVPSFSNAATVLALAVIGTSTAYALLERAGVSLLLTPAMVMGQYAYWQLLTFIPATWGTGPVLFGALIIWNMGAPLEAQWGRRRFLWFTLGVTALSGVFTVALSWVLLPLGAVTVRGADILSSIIWVAWGLVNWHRPMNLFFATLTGRGFALLGVVMTLLNGVFASFWLVIPDLFALAVTFAVVRLGWSPAELWLRFQSARLRRQLSRRSSHLTVLSGDEPRSRGSDKYLH